VREKDGEVIGLEPMVSWKGFVANEYHFQQVKYEKDGGRNERGHHAFFMCALVALLDMKVSKSKQNGAQAV